MATLSELFRDHFGHEEHLYGWLLNRFADDLDAGGPVAEICRDHLDASRADAVQLRLLAALHRIVLRGDAPELERFYPNLGGNDDADGNAVFVIYSPNGNRSVPVDNGPSWSEGGAR